MIKIASVYWPHARIELPFPLEDREHSNSEGSPRVLIESEGRKHELEQALFTAYFTEHQNVSDVDVLVDVAASIRLPRDEAMRVLVDQRFASGVREAEQHWRRQGIQGVPAVIFNHRHLVSEAQGVENFTRILQQLATMTD